MSTALGMGLFAWAGVVALLALVTVLVRYGLDRLRHAAWDREWTGFGRKPTRW